MNKNRLFWLKAIFTALGAVGGFLYWKFVGCTSGTCPIRSVWYYSTLWGAAMGVFAWRFIWQFSVKAG